MKLKNCVKALVVHNNAVLMLRKEYPELKPFYTLPGGSQQPGESLVDALRRETLEEAGVKIMQANLVRIYEHAREFHKIEGQIRHKVEYLFRCTVTDPESACMGKHPDPHQVSVEWIALNALPGTVCSPEALGQVILSALEDPSLAYLGWLEDLKNCR